MHPKLRNSLPARIAAWAFIGLILLINILMLHLFGVSVPLQALLAAFYVLAAVAFVACLGCLYVLLTFPPDESAEESVKESTEEEPQDDT